MAVRDLLALYEHPLSEPDANNRILLLGLAELQDELAKLRQEFNGGIPAEVVANIDTSSLEAAIAALKPLPPQDLDLNPVFRSYEQTAAAIKELLGEVKTTNARISGIRSGGGGPSVVGLSDARGNRLIINSNGSINISSDLDGGDAFSTVSSIDGGSA